MPRQLPLPLEIRPALGRGDFLVGPANEVAVRYLDRWPHWPTPVAVFFGPEGCGKSHLVEAWSVMSGAQIFRATSVRLAAIGPVAIEDVDRAPPSDSRDRTLLALMDGATQGEPRGIILTGRGTPAEWPVAVADLSSRLAALVAFPLWAPDDRLLAGLARKLFSDRQLKVSNAALTRMLRTLERTPAAIRTFVADADAKALAERRPVSERLISELLDRRNPA
ncbi:MAG: HdaA/DnaA family protein [Alphaproteobacteria bacterium]